MKLSAIIVPPILISTLSCLSASAEVTGGHASPDAGKLEDVEVQSPLLVQISLLPTDTRTPGTYTIGAQGARDLAHMPVNASQNVCDKARVQYVRVTKLKAPNDKVRLAILASLSTDWFAQSVTVTIRLVDGEKQIKSQTWNVRIGRDINMGVWGESSSKSRELDVDLATSDLETLFAEGHAPTVRVQVAIDDD
jgi:hypothetical protein